MHVSSVTGSQNSPMQTPQLTPIQSFEAGQKACRQGKYADAENYFKEAEKYFSPRFEYASYNYKCTIQLSHCLFVLNKTEEALDFYKKSLSTYEKFYLKSTGHIELDSQMMLTLRSIWASLHDQNKFREIVTVMELLHQTLQQNDCGLRITTLDWLGCALEFLGDFQKALETHQQCATLYPEDFRGEEGLGRCCHNLHNYSDAIDHYYRAINIATKNCCALSHHPIQPMAEHELQEPEVVKEIRRAILHSKQMQTSPPSPPAPPVFCTIV